MVNWGREGIANINWDIQKIITGYSKNGKARTTTEVENIITLDTETSTGYFDDTGRCYPYNHSRAAEGFYDDKTPYSLLYLWQVAIDDGDIKVYMGRRYEDFLAFLDEVALSVFRQGRRLNPKISREATIAEMEKDEKQSNVATVHMYIHNLSFESQFFRNILEPLWVKERKGKNRKTRHNHKVFARNPRKPMKITFSYRRIKWIFHDTVVLTQKTLKNWGNDEELTVQKLDEPGDFYLPIRTPETTLTEDELEYAENDVVTMVYGLRKYKDKYQYLCKIPMTQTGAVRQACKEAAIANNGWMELVKDTLGSYGFDTYHSLCQAYLGGSVHTNLLYAGRHFKAENGELVFCFDFRSSYPAVMVLSKFPIGPLQGATEEEWNAEAEKDPKDRDWYGYAHIVIKGVEAKTWNTFYPSSKCIKLKGGVLDNGKIYSADEMEIKIIDLDWDVFRKTYTYGSVEYIYGAKSKAGRLPKELVSLILDYYGYKTSLKGNDVKKSLYTESKQFINSIYGCAVTRLISDDIDFVGGESPWERNPIDEDGFYEEMEKIRENDQFLSYQIGVWVAGWARWNLWQAMIRLDERVIYCDTDSLKGLFTAADLDWIDEYNAGIWEEAKKTAADLGIPLEKFAPKTPDKRDENGNIIKLGKTKEIGFFDREDDAIEFRAWGAKRYTYRVGPEARENDKDTGIRLTVAGLPKSGIGLLRDDIDNFRPGIHWTGAQSHKITAIYRDNQPPLTWTDRDGKKYDSADKYGIAMVPAPFEFDLAEDYRDFFMMLFTSGKISEDPCAEILR